MAMTNQETRTFVDDIFTKLTVHEIDAWTAAQRVSDMIEKEKLEAWKGGMREAAELYGKNPICNNEWLRSKILAASDKKTEL